MGNIQHLPGQIDLEEWLQGHAKGSSPNSRELLLVLAKIDESIHHLNSAKREIQEIIRKESFTP